jgi:hypothetical protein
MANKALATRQRRQFRVEPSQTPAGNKGRVLRAMAVGKTNGGVAEKNTSLPAIGKTTFHKDKK